jgi:hypothetical protein
MFYFFASVTTYILQIPFFFQDPELEARVQRLKAEAEAREYRRMTENVDCAVSRCP